MKLKTIWTIPAMTLGERFRQTGDWLAQTVAARLPKRVRYWAFIQAGARAIPPNAVVPEQLFVDVLKNVDGGPR